MAVDHGKFDEQIVFKGSRFCFEIEMVSDGTNYEQFQTTLSRLSDSSFRIGGGTRCGFGEIEIIELHTKCLDLTKETDLKLYLDKSSNLSVAWSGWDASTKPASHTDSNQWISYKLKLSPEDCFLFSSGFGDEDTDMTPVKFTLLKISGLWIYLMFPDTQEHPFPIAKKLHCSLMVLGI